MKITTCIACLLLFAQLCFIAARNEVGARYYFQKRVSRILSTGGGGGGGAAAWQGGCGGGRAWHTVSERAVRILLECILV